MIRVCSTHVRAVAGSVYAPSLGPVRLVVLKNAHGNYEYLVTNDLLCDLARLVCRKRSRWRIETIFRDRNIRAVTGNPVARVEPSRLITEDGSAIVFDEALWVTEASGAPWLANTGFPLDQRGFLARVEARRHIGAF